MSYGYILGDQPHPRMTVTNEFVYTTENVIILVVTVTGRGQHPTNTMMHNLEMNHQMNDNMLHVPLLA